MSELTTTFDNESFIDSQLNVNENITSILNNEESMENNLDAVNQIASELNSDSSMKSILDEPFVHRYNGEETDNIDVFVDNENYKISASLKQIRFATLNDFPDVGSDRLIYIADDTKILYGWGTDGYFQLSAGDSNDVDLSNYYTKQETYSRKQIDDKLANLDVDVDFSNYYTKTQTDSLLNTKADKSELTNYVTNDALNSKGYLTEIPSKYITETELDEDLELKMDKQNPTGTGSFSLNRKAGSLIGEKSTAEGSNSEATGTASHAEGSSSATGSYSHSEGNGSTASGFISHAEGSITLASGRSSHSEGEYSQSLGGASHAEGWSTKANGDYSHTEGCWTEATGRSQHVFGEYNIKDTNTDGKLRGNYVEIVGNGTDSTPSNARTLDWDGNEYLAGNLQAAGLTDGTTTKTMTEILQGGGGVTIRRWS